MLSPTASKLTFLLAALIVFGSGVASARFEMTSANYRLVDPVISGGGSTNLHSTTANPTVQAQGVTIGQPAVGEMVGETSGIRLQGGFWPAAASTGIPTPMATASPAPRTIAPTTTTRARRTL